MATPVPLGAAAAATSTVLVPPDLNKLQLFLNHQKARIDAWANNVCVEIERDKKRHIETLESNESLVKELRQREEVFKQQAALVAQGEAHPPAFVCSEMAPSRSHLRNLLFV